MKVVEFLKRFDELKADFYLDILAIDEGKNGDFYG